MYAKICIILVLLQLVWRQLEFAFFGALTSVGALFYFCGKGIVEMAKKKCDYCGRYYEEEHEGTLDNGCPACPHCVAEEEIKEEKTKNKLRIVE